MERKNLEEGLKKEVPNSWTIQRTIMGQRFRQSFVLPNYTPYAWWESDVFEITKSGYFYEYEVKVSVSDFKADAKKRSDSIIFRRGHEESELKHDLLKNRDERGPSRFYFVTPKALLEPKMIPSWAGLIEVIRYSARPWWRARTIVSAPRLHMQKVSDRTRQAARDVCYYRMHDCFLREKK